MPRRSASIRRAGSGSTSSICSGNSHLRMMVQLVTKITAFKNNSQGYTRMRPFPKRCEHPGSRGLARHERQQQNPAQHGGKPDKPHLAVGQFGDTAKGLAPQAGGEKRQQALYDQHQRQRGQQIFTHARSALRYLDGLLFFRYLKNSELGSSTSTSPLFLKLF